MKRILVADDEKHLRLLVRAIIEDAEHQILEAQDGPEALEMAREERPDLLVLDWMMPGITGLEVVRTLREDPDTAAIPVLMLSAKGQAVDRKEGMDAGARAYLIKPFSTMELRENVQLILQGDAAG